MMEGMLRTGDTSMRASTEGRSFTQENTSNIPKTATSKGGSSMKRANVFANAGTSLQKVTITVGSLIIGGRYIDEVNSNG